MDTVATSVLCNKYIKYNKSLLAINRYSVADPGFPQGGGANSPGGAPTCDFAKFFPKTA